MELEKIPSLIAVATFAALSSVVAHEWGYFGIIGRDFQSFFNAYDYVSELLVSIGPVFIILLAVLAVQVAAYRTDNFEPKAPHSKWGKRISDWLQESAWTITFILALLFLDETTRFSLYVLLGLLWLRIGIYVYGHTALHSFARSPAGLLVLVLPSVMISMYGLGRDEAYTDLKDTKDQYRLHAKNKEVGQSVKILRLLDKGAIVVVAETKAVKFYPREDIALLEHDIPKWDTKSFACRRWGWNCSQVSGSSK